MSEMNRRDDNLEEREDEVPSGVEVYDRPERTGISTTWLIIILIILAIVAAAIVWGFVL